MLIITSLQLSSHLSIGLPSGLFPSEFPIRNLYTHLFFPPSSQYLDLIKLTVLGEQQKSVNSSLRNFLHNPSTSSSQCSNIFLKTYSRTCYSCLLIFTAKQNRIAIKVSFLIRLSTNNYAILECTRFAFLLSHSS